MKLGKGYKNQEKGKLSKRNIIRDCKLSMTRKDALITLRYSLKLNPLLVCNWYLDQLDCTIMIPDYCMRLIITCSVMRLRNLGGLSQVCPLNLNWKKL